MEIEDIDDFIDRAWIATRKTEGYIVNGEIVINFYRNGKSVFTFPQECVPVAFFDIAKRIGYKIAVTGNLKLTHEIECSLDDFNALIYLAMEK